MAFDADLMEIAGALSGESVEQNTFRKDQGTELHAVLSGYREGTTVTFVKTYLGFLQSGDPTYFGNVDASLTRIEGEWHFPKHPAQRGRFIMVREPNAAENASARIGAELEFTDQR